MVLLKVKVGVGIYEIVMCYAWIRRHYMGSYVAYGPNIW